jgi:hypothetical protein
VFPLVQSAGTPGSAVSFREIASKRPLKRGSLKTLAGTHRLCLPCNGSCNGAGAAYPRPLLNPSEVFLVTATSAGIIAHLVCANAFIPLIGIFIPHRVNPPSDLFRPQRRWAWRARTGHGHREANDRSCYGSTYESVTSVVGHQRRLTDAHCRRRRPAPTNFHPSLGNKRTRRRPWDGPTHRRP